MNWIAGVAFENRTASKYRLQKLIYHDGRERFGLAAQMTVRCVSKVCEAFKRDKSKQSTFRKHGAMVYDEARSRKDTNHCISKTLVSRLKDTSRAIALEDLRGIRQRTMVKKAQRLRHSS